MFSRQSPPPRRQSVSPAPVVTIPIDTAGILLGDSCRWLRGGQGCKR